MGLLPASTIVIIIFLVFPVTWDPVPLRDKLCLFPIFPFPLRQTDFMPFSSFLSVHSASEETASASLHPSLLFLPPLCPVPLSPYSLTLIPSQYPLNKLHTQALSTWCISLSLISCSRTCQGPSHQKCFIHPPVSKKKGIWILCGHSNEINTTVSFFSR